MDHDITIEVNFKRTNNGSAYAVILHSTFDGKITSKSHADLIVDDQNTEVVTLTSYCRALQCIRPDVRSSCNVTFKAQAIKMLELFIFEDGKWLANTKKYHTMCDTIRSLISQFKSFKVVRRLSTDEGIQRCLNMASKVIENKNAE